MADGKKKLAEKYDSPEDLEAAYLALEKKLGEQGKTLGDLKSQSEQAQALQAQLQQWAPVVNWYAQNEAEVRRRWQLAEQAQQPNGQGAAIQQQAAQLAQQDPNYQFLTPQEKQAFIGEVTQHLAQQVLQPWTNNFTTAAKSMFDQWTATQQNSQRAFTDVLWRTFQRVIPPEKLADAKAWHEEALKYADPAKLDPMAVAQDVLGLKGENQTLKQRLDDMTKAQEEREKAAVPSLGGGDTQLLRPAQSNEAPVSREDRFQKVLEAVKTEHGPEGLNVLVGGR